MIKRSILSLTALLLILASCDDNNSTGPTPPGNQADNRLYVLNEGNFNDSNGSISTFFPAQDSLVTNAYATANGGTPLAGLIQSGTTTDDQLYLAVNRANKLVISDRESLSNMGTIPLNTSITSIALADGNLAYATNLYFPSEIDSVSVIDLQAQEDTGIRIAVGDEPTDIERVGDYIYVANKGFQGTDRTVSVIDVNTNEVVSTLDVGIEPSQLVKDDDDQIWVVARGLVASEGSADQPAQISVIDGPSATITDQFTVEGHPTKLVLDEDNNRGFLMGAQLIELNLAMRSVSRSLFDLPYGRDLYYAEDEDVFYIARNALSDSFTQPGSLVRYTMQGVAVDSFRVGIAPNSIIEADD